MRCPACDEAEPLPWRRAPGSEPADRGTYLLSRCPACGTAVTGGEAPEFEAFNEAGAFAPGAPRGSRAAAPLLRAFDRRRLAILEAARPPGRRLLDAGAGKGRFVAHARAEGWDAQGIEPAARGDAPHVERASLEDASFAPGSFDAITLWHVLEHLDDPAAALTRLHGWLAPGGVLLVGVPNLASLQARIGGPRWYHLDLPRHRTHFTAQGLARLLARTGFTDPHPHHVLLEHNPFGLWQSGVNRLTPTPSWLYNALKRNAPFGAADAVPTALALPLVPVALAAEAAAGAARRGGTVAVTARRA